MKRNLLIFSIWIFSQNHIVASTEGNLPALPTLEQNRSNNSPQKSSSLFQKIKNIFKKDKDEQNLNNSINEILVEDSKEPSIDLSKLQIPGVKDEIEEAKTLPQKSTAILTETQAPVPPPIPVIGTKINANEQDVKAAIISPDTSSIGSNLTNSPSTEPVTNNSADIAKLEPPAAIKLTPTEEVPSPDSSVAAIPSIEASKELPAVQKSPDLQVGDSKFPKNDKTLPIISQELKDISAPVRAALIIPSQPDEPIQINPITSQYPRIDDTDNSAASLISVEQNKFVEDETKVLLLPNDDIILGRLSEEADLEEMDFDSYANLAIEELEKQINYHKQEIIENFIALYDSNFNDTQVFSLREASQEAFNAIQKNDLPKLRTILDYYPVLGIRNRQGDSLLHKAVYADNYSLAKFLIMRGINLTVKDAAHNTALMSAAQYAEYDIKYLLRKAEGK